MTTTATENAPEKDPFAVDTSERVIGDDLGTLAGSLGKPFLLPNTNWKLAIENAQHLYDLAKATETWVLIEHDRLKVRESDEWENAITRVIDEDARLIEERKAKSGVGELAAQKPVSRTSAEKLAEIEPGWKEYQRLLLRSTEDKRLADKWHSIAFQRLTTLRILFDGR